MDTILPPILIALSLAAAPEPATSTGAAHVDPCVTMLDNLSRAASAQGYTMSEKTSSLAGVDAARNQIYARCNSEHGRIDLVSIDGAQVSVELELDRAVGGALEIAGDFPGTGGVTRTAVLTGYSANGLTGFLTATADVGAERAIAEYDLASGAWTTFGDAVAASSRLAPILGSSKIWADGHVFALALSGTWDRLQIETGAADRVLRVMLDVAVPAPDDPRMSKADKDTFKKCLGASATCGVALLLKFGFGSGSACWGASGFCVAAAACSLNSECSRD